MKRVLLASFLLSTSSAAASATLALPARASVHVERILAVVGDQVITLRELRRHAQRDLQKIRDADLAPAELTAREAETFREHLERMIDEELLAQACARAKIVIPATEVDKVLESIAAKSGVSVARVLEVNRSEGGDEATLRSNIFFVLREQALASLRLRPRTAKGEKIDDATMEREIAAMHAELRAKSYIEVRL